ncbi:LysR family transcriptional regulator [Stagnihabitans tardus]|uniref:LysR family transcriptional regulator n=1 Tax=Stagnihabitans tardus TaxID=2699202 RepID=A0AAE5BUL7_9RHOB|nr:LysR family transcriptional regulator [Stagnihabitans tardus]NBZ86253.1 LysR family transcriptional regulator [Stagnihabitans tardus]
MLPRRYLPSLPSLLALEALDRLGTASAAGAELNLTQSAVSHQLTTLEAQLGVPLLIREKGRLSLTPAAQDFVAEARAALARIAQASLTLRANPGGGTLSLAILPAFGMRWLAPRLAGFAKAHPEVTVNLSTRLKPFDFTDAPFDAAIHYGREDWPGAAYLKLMEEKILAVAAPSYRTETPDQVLTLPLLQLESRSGDWHRWFAHHGMPGQRPPAMLFDQFATMQQAAIHGMGAALLPLFLIEEDLASGRLRPLFGPAIPAAGSYYLVWPKDRPPRAPLSSFTAWLGDAR